jgi:sulfatase maturation enzyme AslB (radical SAM superfamily)
VLYRVNPLATIKIFHYFYLIISCRNNITMADQQNFETEAQFLKRITSHFSTEKFIDNFTPKWLLLQWHITDLCNLRCLHCYQPEYADKDITSAQQLSILTQYVKLLKKWNIKGHINITGGEPLISDHLLFLTDTGI